MATTSPTYLPVYSLSTENSPSLTDSLVMQKSSDATSGDVELLTINNLFDLALDATTIAIFTEMGWTE